MGSAQTPKNRTWPRIFLHHCPLGCGVRGKLGYGFSGLAFGLVLSMPRDLQQASASERSANSIARTKVVVKVVVVQEPNESIVANLLCDK